MRLCDKCRCPHVASQQLQEDRIVLAPIDGPKAGDETELARVELCGDCRKMLRDWLRRTVNDFLGIAPGKR